jgi:WhiB family transcriptional regulator, redox-sensing transcriptional regulator
MLWIVPHTLLDGAACLGARALFDRTELPSSASLRDRMATASARQEALRLCGGCPALTPCLAWYDSLSKEERPSGVMAGQLKTPGKAGRPRMQAVPATS